MRRLHEPEERLSVELPLSGELRGRRELAAAELQGDLHAAVPDVVVVLHAARQRVPRRSVCRSVPEARSPDLMNN